MIYMMCLHLIKCVMHTARVVHVQCGGIQSALGGLTFALLCRKETNSIFHATAQALKEFLTGLVDSNSGPTANASGMVAMSPSSWRRLSTCMQQSLSVGLPSRNWL